MPELPDVEVLTRSMDQALRAKRIKEVVKARAVCLNIPEKSFRDLVTGKTIKGAWRRGKWAIADLSGGAKMAISLGMGGEVRYGPGMTRPEERLSFIFRLSDGNLLTLHFWWFGNVFGYPDGDLASCPRIGVLGLDALSEEMTLDAFRLLLTRAKGAIKPFLLDQKRISGIGNVYIQEILYDARIHPKRAVASLSGDEVKALYKAMVKQLEMGIKYGGGPGESDIYGNAGTYWAHSRAGYKDGKPCPRCKATIEKLRTGSAVSFICPACQPL